MPHSEIMNTMIFFLIAVGIIILIIGLIFMKDKTSNASNKSFDKQIEMDNMLKTRINEADKMLQELSQLSSYIKSELEKKHKELLFLYQMIDEKKASSLKKTINNEESVPKNDEEDLKASVFLNNKNYNKIIELYKMGKDTSTIARQLKIGKGEVELILGLAKMG